MKYLRTILLSVFSFAAPLALFYQGVVISEKEKTIRDNSIESMQDTFALAIKNAELSAYVVAHRETDSVLKDQIRFLQEMNKQPKPFTIYRRDSVKYVTPDGLDTLAHHLQVLAADGFLVNDDLRRRIDSLLKRPVLQPTYPYLITPDSSKSILRTYVKDLFDLLNMNNKIDSDSIYRRRVFLNVYQQRMIAERLRQIESMLQ